MRNPSPTFLIASLVIALFAAAALKPESAWATLQNGSADVAVGQANLTSSAQSAGLAMNASGLNSPVQAVFDPSGRLWVADLGNGRVLRYSPPFSTGMAADLVIGSPNFTSYGSGCIAAGFSVGAVAFDAAGHLWVSDHWQNRILRFSPPFSNGMAADLVIGQTNFTSCGEGTSATALGRPAGIAFDLSGNLWVADWDNSRVLRFPAPLSTGMSADIVIGQTNFTDYWGDRSQTKMRMPWELAFDSSGALWVSDNSNRILRFSPPFSATNQAADMVLGQPDFTSGGGFGFGLSASNQTLFIPRGLAFDVSGSLWVADAGTNRVVRFPAPFSNGMAADLLIGQPDFSALSWGTSAMALFTPKGVAFDSSGDLWVVDAGNNRALEFLGGGLPAAPAPVPAPPAALSPGPSPEPGPPILYFSDINSGPKTGLGDGLGSGAIVTVWGANLGSSQGTSQIFLGGAPAAHVYYWGNADRSGASGPADLYAYHRMQTISFSVSGSAADGAGAISVSVGGANSNALPFTVRPGGIHFVKTPVNGGGDSNSGSWSSPWATLGYVETGAGALSGGSQQIKPGDTVYIGDGVGASNGFVLGGHNGGYYLYGTSTAPISFIAYPGARVAVNGGIGNYMGYNTYINFSKLSVGAFEGAVGAFHGMRLTGMEVTNAPGACPTGGGWGGGIEGTGQPTGADLIFGNYVHDYGCDITVKYQHTTYLSNRGQADPAAYAQPSYEMGWNYFLNNQAHSAFHVYDEYYCDDYYGTMRFHDNVVVNQVSDAQDIASGCSPGYHFSMPVEIYNNLYVNTGRETMKQRVDEYDGDSGHFTAVDFGGGTTLSTIKFYNNTIVGYGMPAPYGGSALATNWGLGGSYEWKNNIVVDTLNHPYFEPSGFVPPAAVCGNVWYSQVPGHAPSPSFDPTALSTDPQFANAAQGVYVLQTSSPLVGKGCDTSSVAGAQHDLLGRPRTFPYDIGAYGHILNATATVPAPPRGFHIQ